MNNEFEISFSALIQDFFCQRLITQQNASPQTIASYRDTFRLFLQYTQERINKKPASFELTDIDAPLVLDFLDYLENERGNTPRSRNIRLAAIRSFLNYASYRNIEALSTIRTVLAIPLKRFDRPPFEYLSPEEMEAIITSPDKSTFSGHRDYIMFMTFYNTGARVSEITRLQYQDVYLENSAFVVIHGKGRKQRSIPLWRSTAKHMKNWCSRLTLKDSAPVFPNRNGKPLTRSGVEYRLRLAVTKASEQFPALRHRKISPHTVRHTTAMHLLQSGVDITVIALWLGHESPATTHMYVEADLKMKEQALKKVQDPSLENVRYKAKDSVLAFLENL